MKRTLSIKIFFMLNIFALLDCQGMTQQTPSQQANVLINTSPRPNSATSIPPKPSQKYSGVKKETAHIYLNFENATLTSVLNYLAEEKKLNIFPHKDLETTRVSLSTRTPLSLERAWNVLLTLLEMNGFSIINVNDLYRVVLNKDNGAEPLPTYSSKNGIEPESLPDTDIIIRYVYFFNNIKAEMAQNILSSMLEGNLSVQINTDLNACVIKEKSMNIKSAMKIIKELDNGGLRESIQIIKLKEADIENVQVLFEEILGTEKEHSMRFAATTPKKSGTYFSTDTRIIADAARNSLILLGTKKNLERITSFIYQYIDVPIGSAQSRLHIKEIRYAKAESLKPILENIIKPPKGQGSEKSVVVGRYKFFEDVIISAEIGGAEESRGSGNRLIISCNQDDWKRLNAFIDQLDKPQPQIALEVLIVDISEDQYKALGTQLQSKPGKEIGMGLHRASFQNDAAMPTSDTGAIPALGNDAGSQNLLSLVGNDGVLSGDSPTTITLGKVGDAASNNIWAIIQANFNVTNSHVIAQPYLIANNFQECTVDISDTKRVTGALRSDRGENKVATKEDKKAGTILTITPKINTDGIIDLDLNVRLDSFITSLTDQPVIGMRNIITKASVMAGEVLVLGGLKTSNQAINEYKTPFLADIPLIGNLFKSKSKTKTETNLYVFIRPSVIKPQFGGSPDDYTQLKLDYAKYQMMRSDSYVKDADPIQRWFFKPTHGSVKKTIADAQAGVFRSIDDFTYGTARPKTVNIKEDPYYKVTEAIQESKKKMKKRKGMKKIMRKEPPKATQHDASKISEKI